MTPPPPRSTLFPYTTLFRSWTIRMAENGGTGIYNATGPAKELGVGGMLDGIKSALNSNATFTWANAEFLKQQDRKSTRLNSSHPSISYAVFCLKKKREEGST